VTSTRQSGPGELSGTFGRFAGEGDAVEIAHAEAAGLARGHELSLGFVVVVVIIVIVSAATFIAHAVIDSFVTVTVAYYSLADSVAFAEPRADVVLAFALPLRLPACF
jgi:hypothetical protein